jgi:hypothetical protein
MKKVLLIAVAILFAAGAAHAVLPTEGYIGLFTGPSSDSPAQTAPSGQLGVWYTGERTTFYMWIWVLPSTNGMRAAEWMIQLPEEDNVALADVTGNPGLTLYLGTLTSGISAVFETCQTDWAWYFYVEAYLLDDVSSVIKVVEDPTAQPPFLGLATCSYPYPLENILPFSYLYMNPASGLYIGTKEMSWGAIKSLF